MRETSRPPAAPEKRAATNLRLGCGEANADLVSAWMVDRLDDLGDHVELGDDAVDAPCTDFADLSEQPFGGLA